MPQDIDTLTKLPVGFSFKADELKQHADHLAQRLADVQRRLRGGVAKSEYDQLHKAEQALSLSLSSLRRIKELASTR